MASPRGTGRVRHNTHRERDQEWEPGADLVGTLERMSLLPGPVLDGDLARLSPLERGARGAGTPVSGEGDPRRGSVCGKRHSGCFRRSSSNWSSRKPLLTFVADPGREEHRAYPAPPPIFIHPSAWKGNSSNFAFRPSRTPATDALTLTVVAVK